MIEAIKTTHSSPAFGIHKRVLSSSICSSSYSKHFNFPANQTNIFDTSMLNISPLLQPASLGTLKLRNRIHMGALTRNRSKGNVPSDIQVEHYRQRARGGAGLIITEGILIVQQGSHYPNAPGIWSQEHICTWKKVIDAVHVEGGAIYAQLWHVGRIAHPEAPERLASGQPVYAPSAIAPVSKRRFRFLPGQPGYQTPTAVENPRLIVEQFRQAAINAKAAGFDGIEVHAAGGFLISQFLSTHSNKRTDGYGRTVEGRSRFGLEVLKAVTDVWGPHRVGVKLMPAGGINDAAMPLDDAIKTYSYFIGEADKLGLAYIQLMLHIDARRAFDPTAETPDVPHDVLETYRPFIKNTPIFINGSVNLENAAKLVSEGTIGGVVLARPWISMPDVVRRLERGLPLDVPIDIKTQYTNEDQARGYNDYPAVTELLAAAQRRS